MGKKDNEVPDIEVDESLFSEMLRGFNLMPEQRFLLSYLQRAILDYVGPADTPIKARVSARVFFTSYSQEVMSFNWCVDHLPWDGEWFMGVIYTYINEKLAERAAKEEEDILFHVQEG